MLKHRVLIPADPGKADPSKYIITQNKKFLAGIKLGSVIGRINNWGVELALSGKFSEAEILFQDVIKEKPEEAAAYNNLGVIYEIFGHNDKAFEMYSAACMKEPGNDYFRHNFLTFADNWKK